MPIESDEAKNLANQRKHELSFQEAQQLFDTGNDYMEIFDRDHSDFEDRFIAIGPITRGLILVVYTEIEDDINSNHQRAIGNEKRTGRLPSPHGTNLMTDEIPELTEEQMMRGIPARTRKRLMKGQFESGDDVVNLRNFVGLTQIQFAEAIGISVHTLRNWEQDRRKPDGPAIALLRIAARHPRIIRENLESAA